MLKLGAGSGGVQTMVAFSVYKAGKYLFDCVNVAGDAEHLPFPTVDLAKLEAIGITAVDIMKRLDFAEVDRLIACCRLHPPQVVVVPATEGDKVRFEEFAMYLKTRQRAGVSTLPDGRLLLLSPLEQDSLRLRCVVVKAKPTTPDSVATDMTAIRIEGAAPVPKDVLPSGNAQRSVPTEATQKPPRSRSRSRRKRGNQEVTGSTMEEPPRSSQEATTATEKIVLLNDLPRMERATRIAQLRHEYEAFNDLHYRVLRTWTSEDPEPDT